jgi:hypothetical protein
LFWVCRIQLVDFIHIAPSLLRLLRLLNWIIFEIIFLFLWCIYFPLDVILVNIVKYRSELMVLFYWSENNLSYVIKSIYVIISVASLLCSVLFIWVIFIKLLQTFIYLHFLTHYALSLYVVTSLIEIKIFRCFLLLILLILLYWFYLIFYFKVLYLWLLLQFIFIN